jgi:hypothetical protein
VLGPITGSEEDLDPVVGAREPGPDRGVLVVAVGEGGDRPAAGDIVALPALGEAGVDIDRSSVPVSLTRVSNPRSCSAAVLWVRTAMRPSASR